jgi:hypothetical protein
MRMLAHKVLNELEAPYYGDLPVELNIDIYHWVNDKYYPNLDRIGGWAERLFKDRLWDKPKIVGITVFVNFVKDPIRQGVAIIIRRRDVESQMSPVPRRHFHKSTKDEVLLPVRPRDADPLPEKGQKKPW